MQENFERNFRPQPEESHNQEDPKQSESDNESPETQEAGKQKLFMSACNERLDELVRLDMLPKKFAEERREAAMLISEGLSDNPEDDGIYFAEVGLESISVFRRGIDEVETKFLAKIQPAIEAANSLLLSFEENNRQEETSAIRGSLTVTEGQLTEFREAMQRVKALEMPFNETLGRIPYTFSV